MTIDIAVRQFSGFLNTSWAIVSPMLVDRAYTTNESSMSDWIQANWELLVERNVLELNQYLEFYGDGADFYGDSSRITDTEAAPNFYITVVGGDKLVKDLLNDEMINPKNLVFDKLVGFENRFYADRPPFSYVLVKDELSGVERVFHIEGVKFNLKKY